MVWKIMIFPQPNWSLVDGSLNRQIASQVIILAEDERHQNFARRYLYRLGFQRHDLLEIPLPVGKGCGEQWVRKQYAKQVKACRIRAVRAKSALMVIIDADTEIVEKRVEQLKMELVQTRLNPRTATEKVIHLIPRRNIETWILHLTGSHVDEQSDYKQAADIDLKLQDAALRFFDLTRPHEVPPTDCLPSLLQAIEEAKRLE